MDKAGKANPPSSEVGDAPTYYKIVKAALEVACATDYPPGAPKSTCTCQWCKSLLALDKLNTGITSLVRVLADLHALAYDVAAHDWGPSVSEAYHNVRMARMGALRQELNLKTGDMLTEAMYKAQWSVPQPQPTEPKTDTGSQEKCNG